MCTDGWLFNLFLEKKRWSHVREDSSYLQNVSFKQLEASCPQMNPLASFRFYFIDTLVVIIII